MGPRISDYLAVCSQSSKPTKLHFTSFMHMLPMAVAWFSSGGTVICYVLPVLWMISCFYIMARWCMIGPIPWGHSGPLCHVLSLSSSSSWTSMRACDSSDTW